MQPERPSNSTKKLRWGVPAGTIWIHPLTIILWLLIVGLIGSLAVSVRIHQCYKDTMRSLQHYKDLYSMTLDRGAKLGYMQEVKTIISRSNNIEVCRIDYAWLTSNSNVMAQAYTYMDPTPYELIIDKLDGTPVNFEHIFHNVPMIPKVVYRQRKNAIYCLAVDKTHMWFNDDVIVASDGTTRGISGRHRNRYGEWVDNPWVYTATNWTRKWSYPGYKDVATAIAHKFFSDMAGAYSDIMQGLSKSRSVILSIETDSDMKETKQAAENVLETIQSMGIYHIEKYNVENMDEVNFGSTKHYYHIDMIVGVPDGK